MFNGGKWTPARKRSFIMSALRAASNRWPPKFEVKKKARTERGVYTCAGYKRKSHSVPASIKEKDKRVNNVAVDHIYPVIDPSTGFVSWDNAIERLFVEAEHYQILCRDCHALKTSDERKLRKEKGNPID